MMQIETRGDGLQVARFRAMNDACEVLAEGADPAQFARAAAAVAAEVWRIERKFTRFGSTGVIALLRRRAGRRVRVDAETADLIDRAALWHARSGGSFDITVGPLQRLWRFGKATTPPDAAALARTLRRVGFQRLRWERPALYVPAGMELDLGGLGKEYAVDRAHDLLATHLDAPALVNCGGDLRVTRAPHRGHWRIGLETAAGTRAGGRVVALAAGALATSGNTRRHVLVNGVRYGHVLDPRSGWPLADAPAAVSVAAPSCIEAGLLAKIALLRGRGAAAYLAASGARGWIAPEREDLPT